MTENGSHHRHAVRPRPEDRRRNALLIAVSVLVVAALAVVLVVLSWDRSGDAVAERSVAPPAATSTPADTPATTPAATAGEAATTPDVPADFVAAMQQVGIPLDPHTGWVVAQGICTRLGQPQYDQFRMAEGIERLFPSVPDDRAHAFVAMVAESVCGT